MSDALLKYPRTPHLETSRLQPGDDAGNQIPFAAIQGAWIVVEEKMDGANSGISFNADANLRLQSRGHFLTGGPRERQFDQLKSWATAHQDALLDRLEDRYIVYGEWMATKHTVFYDALPHLFLEFDVYDRRRGVFLSTKARRALLKGLPIVSVPVLYEGRVRSLKELLSFVGPSTAKTARWREVLRDLALQRGLDAARVLRETELSDLMEGLYIKVETDEETIGRFKWVRPDFLQAILDSGSHWIDRPHLLNLLRPGLDLFAPELVT